MSQNESWRKVLVNHRPPDTEPGAEHRYFKDYMGKFRLRDMYMASYALVARTNFRHDPPYRYAFLKNRAGYSPEAILEYGPNCPEMGVLMLIVPGMGFEKSNAPTGLDLVFTNRRDLKVFQMATAGHETRR